MTDACEGAMALQHTDKCLFDLLYKRHCYSVKGTVNSVSDLTWAGGCFKGLRLLPI